MGPGFSKKQVRNIYNQVCALLVLLSYVMKPVLSVLFVSTKNNVINICLYLFDYNIMPSHSELSMKMNNIT